MKISESTLAVLKNFAAINESIILEAGNTVRTTSNGNNIMAHVEVEDTFPQDFPIYNLNAFLNTLSLFKDPDVIFNEGVAAITDGGSTVKFRRADPKLIQLDHKDIAKYRAVPSDVEFTLTQDVLKNVLKAAAVMSLTDIKLVNDEGTMRFVAHVKKNTSSNSYGVDVGEAGTEDFQMDFKTSNLTLLPGDYKVRILKARAAHFKHLSKDLEYVITLEPSSYYGSK